MQSNYLGESSTPDLLPLTLVGKKEKNLVTEYWLCVMPKFGEPKALVSPLAKMLGDVSLVSPTICW